MALKNVIGNGGYTVIDIHQYIKSDRHIGIEVVTYTDKTKQHLVGRFEICVQGDAENETMVQMNRLHPKDWEKWFGAEAISGDSNILKQCYLFLKSTDQFKGCDDC